MLNKGAELLRNKSGAGNGDEENGDEANEYESRPTVDDLVIELL